MASKQEAVLAVRLYNDPGRERTLESFIVHMHIAWLYAFQAKWMKLRRNYFVIRAANPIQIHKWRADVPAVRMVH